MSSVSVNGAQLNVSDKVLNKRGTIVDSGGGSGGGDDDDFNDVLQAPCYPRCPTTRSLRLERGLSCCAR